MATSIRNISVSNNILSGSSANLVVTRDMIRNFGSSEDYVEMHISDPAGRIIYSVVPFQNYTIPGVFQPSTAYTIQELVFDPETDLKNIGISYGDYVITYNVLRPKIVLDYNPSLFIKEISGDRTEIRLSSNNISTSDIETNTTNFINDFNSLAYFKEFYLNFGRNKLYPCVNIALDLNQSTTVLIKLLNPLPLEHKVNDLLNVVDAISNPQVFEAEITIDSVPVVFPTLRGPNFDLDLDNLRVGPTPYYNFSQITSFQGNFAPQLQQLLGQLSASNFALNIDYTYYENFVHFSSAARRLEGFKWKLTSIEALTEAIDSASTSPSPTSQLDIQSYQSKINGFIQSFDGWEQYLYFESSSYTWPKQNPDRPYLLYSVTSSEGLDWYSGNYDSSSLYDDNNQNYILYTLPGYITENTDNELAFKFVASVGQMFDDIWIHIKAITDLYKAKNSLTEGISKDLVYFALQSMGIDVYTDRDGTTVFRYLYGIDENGNYLPPTGSYDTLISASNYQLSGQDQQKGIYKRLYHNLPLLLKSKGTTRFIQYLNTVFGVPSTVMSYIEYGGVDKITSSFEYEYDRFTYGLDLSGSTTISVPWDYLDQSTTRTGFNDIVADAIELRFRPFVTASNIMISSYATQSLFYNGTDYSLRLLYTDTGSNNSIYANTTGDFGYLEFELGGTTVVTPTVPVFTTGSDGETSWYSVLVQRRFPNRRVGQVGTSQTYDIYIKNNIFGEIGHVASASLTTTNNGGWYNDGSTLTVGGGTFPFSGSVQELRLWSYKLNEDTFDSHVLNPESIEGNTTTSSFEDLAVRFTLGNNLYTYNHTVTTTLDSTHPDQNTQVLTATFANFADQNNYSSFTETYYADVANSGYANPVVDKVRIYSGSAYGTQLLPNKSIEITPQIPLTKDIHLLDASLSPQDEIDRAIIAALGSTYNLDDIIGDPDPNTYNQLFDLRNEFFKKFNNKYNYKDYIRLIEFFHNSLFRTLKDFTPARTNLATGIVIKPHLLERPVVKRPELNATDPNNLSGSIITAFITASNGGDYSQSLYDITYNTPRGYITLQSDARDFFVGEFPSSSIDVKQYLSDGVFNPFLRFNPYALTPYSASIWNYDYNPLLNNVSRNRESIYRFRIVSRTPYYETYTKSTYNFSGGPTGGVVTYLDWNRVYRVLNINPSSFALSVQVLDGTIVIYGDVNQSFPSSTTPVSVTFGILNTSSAEVQDFTYNYYRHTNPRYFGSKTTSTNYNFYDDNDFSFGLSRPYGKNPTINSNTIQFAYFERAECEDANYLFARERTNLYLQYLIDENGNLTELIGRDYSNIRSDEFWNLYQVQNIYKQGTIANIFLFDTQTPTQQKRLNGNKLIFESGTKYYPTLWRTFNVPGYSGLTYTVPEGYVNDAFFDPRNWSITYTSRITLGLFTGFDTTFNITVTYTPPGGFVSTLPFDIIVNTEARIYQRSLLLPGGYNYTTKEIPVLVPRLNQNGAPNYTGNASFQESGRWFISGNRYYVASVRAANGSGLPIVFDVSDSEPYLKIHSQSIAGIYQPTNIISCSAQISKFYFEEFYYSGSNFPPSNLVPPLMDDSQREIVIEQNTYCPPELPFSIKVGDLIRFDSRNESNQDSLVTPFFLPQYEYTVMDVDTTNVSSDKRVTFTLNEIPDNTVTSSIVPFRINRYIFASKVIDESNMIVLHKKNPGLTSGGIVKNQNISQRVDNKVANIIGDLKSKIFSTVLTS